MKCNEPGPIGRGEYVAAVEYGYHPLLGAIVADANQDVSGEHITANGNEIADSLKDYVPLFKVIIGSIQTVIRRYRRVIIIYTNGLPRKMTGCGYGILKELKFI